MGWGLVVGNFVKLFVLLFGLYQIYSYYGDKVGIGLKEMWCCNKKFIWLCIMSV